MYGCAFSRADISRATTGGVPNNPSTGSCATPLHLMRSPQGNASFRRSAKYFTDSVISSYPCVRTRFSRASFECYDRGVSVPHRVPALHCFTRCTREILLDSAPINLERPQSCGLINWCAGSNKLWRPYGPPQSFKLHFATKVLTNSNSIKASYFRCSMRTSPRAQLHYSARPRTRCAICCRTAKGISPNSEY